MAELVATTHPVLIKSVFCSQYICISSGFRLLRYTTWKSISTAIQFYIIESELRESEYDKEEPDEQADS